MGLAILALAIRGITIPDTLADSDWRVRRDTAEAVGKTKGFGNAEVLLAALNDGYWQVVQKSAWSLAQIGDLRAVPALARLLLEHPESNVRKEAAVALATLAPDNASTLLRRALDDPDADVRKLARRALENPVPESQR